MPGNAVFKDVALRAVGRTVVNFQRLEHNLKIAARLGPLEGVLAKIQRDFERRTEKTSSFTLGQVIEAWLSAINGSAAHTNPTPDLFDPTIRVSFSLQSDSEFHRAHGDALKELLEIRNRLIHGGLVNFDWECRDACERLVAELTEVNEAIGVQIDFVAVVVKSFRPEGAAIEVFNGDGEKIFTAQLGSDT
jgi:hypothetical protein